MSFAYLEQNIVTGINKPVHVQPNELNNKQRVPAHWHEDIEILHFLSGTATVLCDNNLFEIEKECLVFFNSNAIHSVVESSGRQCLYTCMKLNAEFIRKGDIQISNNLFIAPAYNNDIIRRFEELKETVLQKKPPLVIKFDCLSFVAHLLQEQPSFQSDSSDSNSKVLLVKDIISYIKQHINTPLTADEIFLKFNYSKSYICRIIKQYTQLTLIENINLLRCQYAKNLLLSSNCSVQECAEKSGFENVSYFSKTYLRYIGELPSATKRIHI